MSRRYPSWWQGALVGAGLGVAGWQAAALAGDWAKPTRAVGLSARGFAQLTQQPTTAEPRLDDVVVHPTLDGRTLLTARAVGGRTPGGRVEFLAPVPFDAPAKPGRPAATYADLRAALAADPPTFAYRYAWWEVPGVRAALWIAPPTLALGALMPLAIALLVSRGLLAAPEPKPRREPKAKPSTPPAPKPTVDGAAIVAQLDAVTQHLADGLAGRADEPAGVAPTIATPSPDVRPMPPPDAPIAPPPTPDPTTFDGGVYYPVHRPQRGE